MDPIRSATVRTNEEVVEDKRKSKLVGLIQNVRERVVTSPRLQRGRIKSLRRDSAVVETAPKPASSGLITPTVIWSPTQLQDAKKTIANILDELANLIPRTRLSSPEKQKHALTYLKGLKVILKAMVCHADLKPANILWGKNSFVISDFNGAIFIDRICELMNPDFIFEGEEEKTHVRRIVQHLSDPLSRPLKSPHLPSLEKLARWEIITTDAIENYSKDGIHDRKKLRSLREYIATKFLPPPTKGYASDQYRNAMCNYFWRCEKENFTLACQAYDMRAAALTISAILTGTHPPDVEDDREYYDALEKSLIDFGLSKKAASLIRKMAEPHVPPLGMPFTLRVTVEDLQKLELELYQDESPCIQVESSAEDEDQEANLKKLEHVRRTLEALKFAISHEEQKDDPTIIKEITEDLIGAKAEQIDPDTRLALIEGAFAAYRDGACASTLEVEGKTYDTVLLIDPTDLQSCDIVLREKRIGDGGSAVAYKAFSLRSSQYVVLKYFLETADPLEANNSKAILEHINKYAKEVLENVEGLEAIQPCPKLFRLQIKEEYQQVAVEPYYENCDYASCVFGDLFCSKWKIPKEQEPIRRVLKELDDRLQDILAEFSSSTEKLMHVDAFEGEYAKTFTGILGQQKAMSLFEAYRILATATPTSRLRSLSRDCHDSDVATQLVQKCIRVLRNLSIIDTEALQDAIEAESSQEEALKEKAKKIMVQSIRKCQGEVFREWLQTRGSDDNPVTAAKDWVKRATATFGEKHLDLEGINRICKVLQMNEKVKPNPQSVHQQTLVDLNKIVANIIIL